jgi:hypothetical protein
MNQDPLTIQHAFASLRFAFHVLGFQQTYSEILVLQHTTQVSFGHPAVTAAPVMPSHGAATSSTSSVESLDDVEEAAETLKEVTITAPVAAAAAVPAPKKKYIRTVPEDAQRCTQLLSTGQRCTFTKAEKSELCTRHHAATAAVAAE